MQRRPRTAASRSSASADQPVFEETRRRIVEWVRGRPRRRLFTSAEGSPERTLAWRLALVLSLLAIVVAIYWLDRSGLRDHSDGEISFADVVYFTMVTVTTVGYGDIVPVSDRARLIDAFLVTPIRLFIWFIFLGTAYQFVIQKVIEDFRMSRLQKKLSGHVIVCGYGRSGQIAVRELVDRGYEPNQVLVIDQNENLVRLAAEDDHIGLSGDPTKESILRDAGIGTASAIVISLGRDDTTALAVLTARHLNRDIRIVVSSRETENADLLRQAGANAIVSLGRINGFLLADAVVHAHTANYVLDLLTTKGRVALIEREARPEDIGRPMREIEEGLVVRLLREGRPIGFWEEEQSVVRAGDVLVVILPAADVERTPKTAGSA
jgi:voltage-gated potassium channel